MRFWLFKKNIYWFFYLIVLSTSHIIYADTGANRHHLTGHAESKVEVKYFNAGNSTFDSGSSSVNTSGVLLEAEYESNDMVFSFGYENWNYQWTTPETLPFVNSTGRKPWTTFTTFQLGFSYEHEISEQWEFNYYVEAESSYERESSNSNEYEVGVDFSYEASDAWVFTVNLNYEYLDAEGGELGADFGIEWNHDKKEGWSGEFEISSEFPETSITYHFIKEFSTTLFYNESGTNTIRLSDDSPVIDMQAGYFEDEYNSIGLQFSYELAQAGKLSLLIQRNMNRTLNFADSSGENNPTYKFDDVTELSIKYSYTF